MMLKKNPTHAEACHSLSRLLKTCKTNYFHEDYMLLYFLLY